MAKCEVCGKTPQFGHNVSHSNRKTNRQFRPNIQRIKVMENGRLVSKYVCTQCIKTMSKDAKAR
ncbi:MAG TPA: 50S ribosomal protein L28 [Aggregatilinea sp.]|jgi:large subunit ribosomal protein L28|uniref:50S ribosomal protein L28 n=1 Tax=Aggregatilinea sp. TaxID=2806333 RepID=UPI002CFC2DB9|nr:50S ribosomal protein L28 [Aggregatilinea sp.]HML22191.1 50S ribosomal protein L28 [Aggregatilinea sp.]